MTKMILTVFWDAREAIAFDYLREGRAIIGENYANLLNRFNDNLKTICLHLVKKSAVSPRKCKITPIVNCYDEINSIGPRIAFSSAIFSRFSFK